MPDEKADIINEIFHNKEGEKKKGRLSTAHKDMDDNIAILAALIVLITNPQKIIPSNCTVIELKIRLCASILNVSVIEYKTCPSNGKDSIHAENNEKNIIDNFFCFSTHITPQKPGVLLNQ